MTVPVPGPGPVSGWQSTVDGAVGKQTTNFYRNYLLLNMHSLAPKPVKAKKQTFETDTIGCANDRSYMSGFNELTSNVSANKSIDGFAQPPKITIVSASQVHSNLNKQGT